MKSAYPLSLILILVVSCTDRGKHPEDAYSTKAATATGIVVMIDNAHSPLIIPVGQPRVVPAGQPKIIPAHANVIAAGDPKVVVAGTPTVNTPGTDTFALPVTVAAKRKIFRAGIPEVVVAKDAAANDINPANFSFYKTMQGLKHNSVRCMLQDKTGNLWFGAYGGVCRYDGKSFTSFTENEGLVNNFVVSMLEDKAGNLWFGTSEGACRYDGKSFTHFTEREGLCNNFVSHILEDRTGKIWFGTYGGVCSYDGKSFTTYATKQGLSNNEVFCMLEDRAGNIWIGTDGGGVCRFDGKSFSNYSSNEGLSHNTVWSMMEDKTGNIWFGTDGGACRYDGNVVNENSAATFTTFSETEGLANSVVLSIQEDETGRLWFGTNGGGASLYDGKTFSNFNEKEGLSDNVVWSVLMDKTGNIWMGTNTGGVCRYNGKVFTIFTQREGLVNNIVLSILEDRKGNLWFGTYKGGLSRYDGESFSNFTTETGLTDYTIWCMEEDTAGNIWLGTDDGLCRYDGKTFTYITEKEGLGGNAVASMLEDKSGVLWLGTNGGGVYRYDGKNFTIFTEEEGLGNNIVICMLEDSKGNLWFGTNGGGVSRYDGNSITTFNEKDGLSSKYVWSILEDNSGNMWFGTNGGGACRFDGKHFVKFTEKDGLSNNAVLNMLQDKVGNIWFGTRLGLSKMPGSRFEMFTDIEAGQPKTEHNGGSEALFYNYGYNDGFLGLNCRRDAVLQDSKGRIWWGTDILICYHPEGDITDENPPNVNVTSIKLFGEEIQWPELKAVMTDSTGKETGTGLAKDTVLANGVVLSGIEYDGISPWFNLPQHLSLPYNNSNITFSFIGVHMQSRNHVKYQYKLEGYDPNWSAVTDRTESPYGNLPHGQYIFKVKAMNQSGAWSEPFEYAFEVRPPWWETTWFRSSALGFIVVSIVGFFRYRTSQLRARQRELEKTVAERTAEVVEQKQLVEEKQKDILDSINYAQRIQHSLLASEKLLNAHLHEYFILFLPKDIVSGDFYWATELPDQKFALVTADSTGHGVPGAIMSMLNISCLEKAVDAGHTSPAEILNYTRTRIIERLANDGSAEGGKDGMDCSLVCFDFKNHKLSYTAAHNPVWIVRNSELKEFPADKMPVGKHDNDSAPFSEHSAELLAGDVVYTITDGFADQFGGPKGKKFMYKKLKSLIVSIASLPMQEQKVRLLSTLNEWKSDNEQVDDITVIGVRVMS